MSPKIHILKSWPTVPQDVTLCGNKAFADAVKEVILQGGECVIQCGWCPCRKERFGHRNTHRENFM